MLSFIHQSILICYVILGVFTPKNDLNRKLAKHPLHLGSVELNYNTKSATVEVSCRVFTDDFEDLLGKNFKTKADLSAPAKHKDMDVLIKKYMSSHLQISGNGKVLPLNYLGFDNDNEAIIIYMETVPVKSLKTMETSCTILYDSFDDQTNIFHVIFNGNRKSSKLTYPDKKFISIF